jgi:hypothetical protein
MLARIALARPPERRVHQHRSRRHLAAARLRAPNVVMMHLGNTHAVTCTAAAGGVSFTVSGRF